MKYIIGLGNLGEKYVGTRHNIGADFVRAFAQAHEFPAFAYDKLLNADTSRGEVKGTPLTLVIPGTYMNNSGEVAQAICKKDDGQDCASRIIVVHDELDLPLGTVRDSFGSRSAGHNGVQSIIDALGTNTFYRVRIGISPPDTDEENTHALTPMDVFVLERFTEFELQKLSACREAVFECITDTISSARI